MSPAAERVTLWADITKNGKDRAVTLPQRVIDAMPQRRGPDDPVFLNAAGEPWAAYDGINLALKRAAKRAGVRHVSCHVLRHTWATWFYAATRDLEKLMAFGGWASPELAMRYMHAAGDDLTAEVQAHNWEFSGKRPPRPRKISRKVS